MGIELFAVALFFVLSFGFGHSLTRLVNEPPGFIERWTARLTLGLATLIIFGVVVNLLGLPIDWKIFLLFSSLIPIVSLFKSRNFKFRLKLKKSQIFSAAALLIFLVSLGVNLSGAFSYPYLEDDDPWQHALAAKYVATEKMLNNPDNFNIKYLDPYPPAYAMTMGLLHQVSSSISWTLKFFNALIASLTLLIFYFFAKEFTGNKQIALLSTFILASVPSFLTHFIWAHSLVILMFITSLYALERTKHDKSWIYPAAISIAAILLTQPSQALKIGFLILGYFVIFSFSNKKFQVNTFTAMFGGFILSLVWWAFKIPALIGSRTTRLTEKVSTEPGLWGWLKLHFPPNSGTATRAYNVNDFFIAKSYGLINNPVGLGIFVSLLTVFALVIIFIRYRKYFRREMYWVPVTLFWLVFTFLAINTMTFDLPIGFFGFRTWMLLAIPVSLLSGFAGIKLAELCRRLGVNKSLVLFVLVLGIFATSGYQKYSINTSTWPPGATWTSIEEVNTYLWLKDLPVDTKVFDPAPAVPERFIIGLDKYSCAWCPDTQNLRDNFWSLSVEDTYSILNSQEYEYVIVGGMSIKQLSETVGSSEAQEMVQNKVQELGSSTYFDIAYQTNSAIIFKIRR